METINYDLKHEIILYATSETASVYLNTNIAEELRQYFKNNAKIDIAVRFEYIEEPKEYPQSVKPQFVEYPTKIQLTPVQPELNFESEEKIEVKNDLKTLLSAIFCFDNEKDSERLFRDKEGKIEEWEQRMLKQYPELQEIEKMGRNLYGWDDEDKDKPIFKGFKNCKRRTLLQVYLLWKTGKATIEELKNFTSKETYKNIEIKLVIANAHRDKEKDLKNFDVAYWIDELFDTWKQ